MLPSANESRPLADWRFRGELRHYQADVLDRVEVTGVDPLHIVAPPGSGKTLLGLLLAARRGSRAVALAPTTTIRDQWARAGEHLATDTAVDSAADAGDRPHPAVSTDPLVPGDLTVLTYQALSVLERTSPLDSIAEVQWQRELVAGGRSTDAAAAWIAELAVSNPQAHRAGIVRRSRAVRRRLAAEDPAVLLAALHPNARALIDRLVDAGVQTVLLDECHHLLDHWALVVAALAARIREAGGEPLLIGLTATLPSTDDREAYENYTGLLGDVDYEVPTPAVVKEGNLAPYRDFVRIVQADPDEVQFLREHGRALEALIGGLLATPSGIESLVAGLQPPPVAGAPPLPDHAVAVDAALAAAFAADFALAEASARMLVAVAPTHPLVARLPADAATPPSTDQRIRVLARFALDRLLPDEARRAEWDRVRETLVDFGYTLTDRGIRRGRDPVDSVLASAAAKDRGACEILRLELGQPEGERLRAVVVCDFAVHGNARGRGRARAGALRCFESIAADAVTMALRPVLVTAKQLRIGARDADVLVPELSRRLGVDLRILPIDASSHVVELDTAGVGSAAVVAAVSSLLTDGTIRVVIGTRALLGEGWDCPAANTLIDLTAVATSSATQQLRGRTLRLDPSWPRKVAHNWTVAAVLPDSLSIDAEPDIARMHRKHGRIWGLRREDSTQVVRGLAIALTEQQAARLAAVVHRSRAATVDAFNADVASTLPTRAQSWLDWRIGEPYADREHAAAVVSRPSSQVVTTGPALVGIIAAILGLIGSGMAIAATIVLRSGSADPGILVVGLVVGLAFAVWFAVPLLRVLPRAMRQLVGGERSMRAIAGAVADALRAAGRIQGIGQGDLAVAQFPTASGASRFEIAVVGGSADDQRLVAQSIAELLGPIRTPRFLLEVQQVAPDQTAKVSIPVRLAVRLAMMVAPTTRALPVPTALGRRRADALLFAEQWRRTVGPCALVEIDSPAAMARLTAARAAADGAPEPPVVREQWS